MPRPSSCFDSWVGAVGPDDYRHAILPHTSRILAALGSSGVPRIHFGVGTGELLGLMGEAGANVVGVDWRIPLDEAVRRVEPGKALQGNLDPAILLAPWDVVEERARGSSPAGARPRAMYSTSGTACFRKPTRTCWPGWPTWCTPSRPAPTPERPRSNVPSAPRRGGFRGRAAAGQPAPGVVDREAGHGQDRGERRDRAEEGQRPRDGRAQRVPAGAEAARQGGRAFGRYAGGLALGPRRMSVTVA